MSEPPRQRWGFLQWCIVIGVVVFGCILAMAVVPFTSRSTSQMKGVSNCKQIILSLKMYAKDNGSVYPGAGLESETVSANQVFRRLFQEGIVTDERIFGCPPNSLFVPDGEIGMRPDFAEAVAPGECHWMLLKFQTDFSIGDLPVVVENALNASWPPRWDVSGQTGNKRGRVWGGGKIIVGRNDGSVAVEKLSSDGTIDWYLRSNLSAYAKSWIDTLTPEQLSQLAYWDVEEK